MAPLDRPIFKVRSVRPSLRTTTSQASSTLRMVFNVLFTLLAATAPLVHAGNLYVYPPKSYAVGVNTLEDASAAISRHLGLDRFEQAHQDSKALLVEEDFVGAGVDNSLLLTMSEVDARGASLHLVSWCRQLTEIHQSSCPQSSRRRDTYRCQRTLIHWPP